MPATSNANDPHPPPYGSMFRSDGDAPAANAGDGRGGLPGVVVLVGALALIALSGLVGYWWFTSPLAPSVRTLPTTETEQVVTADAAGGTDGGHGQKPVAAESPAPDRHTEATASSTRQGWTVVTDVTRDAKFGSDVAAEPDGRTAVIAPGGALALAWGGEFYNGAGPDIRVFGPDGDRTPYTLFARTAKAGKWVRFDMNRRGFTSEGAAHDFGHHGVEAVREIMIRNDGSINLYIDAVAPLYIKSQAHDAESAEHAHTR